MTYTYSAELSARAFADVVDRLVLENLDRECRMARAKELRRKKRIARRRRSRRTS